MNCLTFSVIFKKKHKNFKIHVENHLVNILKQYGVKNCHKTLFRYLRYIGFVNSLRVIFEPHFYVSDGVYRYDCGKNSKLPRYTKTLLKEPVHGYQYEEDFEID